MAIRHYVGEPASASKRAAGAKIPKAAPLLAGHGAGADRNKSDTTPFTSHPPYVRHPASFSADNLRRALEVDPAVQVLVRDNNVDQALRALKKKMQREGIFREMKLRRNYEKPSEKRARERAESVRRYRKLLRKRMEREGY